MRNFIDLDENEQRRRSATGDGHMMHTQIINNDLFPASGQNDQPLLLTARYQIIFLSVFLTLYLSFLKYTITKDSITCFENKKIGTNRSIRTHFYRFYVHNHKD